MTLSTRLRRRVIWQQFTDILEDSYTLMMETEVSSDMSEHFHHATRRHVSGKM